MFDKLHNGDHVAHLFGTEAERLQAASLFFDLGASRGRRCVYLCSEQESHLTPTNLPGVELVDRRKAYLRNGAFDPREMYAFLRKFCEDTIDAGYGGLFIAGDMRWALEAEISVDDLCRYESGLNEVFPGLPCLAMCQYDRHRFPARVLSTILKVHHTIVNGFDLLENACFVSHENFLFPEIRENKDVEAILIASKIAGGQNHKDSTAIHSELEACFQVPNGTPGPAATFTELFESSPDMHALLDPSGKIVMANGALRNFVCPNEPPGVLSRLKFIDLLAPTACPGRNNNDPDRSSDQKNNIPGDSGSEPQGHASAEPESRSDSRIGNAIRSAETTDGKIEVIRSTCSETCPAKESEGPPVFVVCGRTDSEFEGTMTSHDGREIFVAVAISPISTRSRPFVKGAVAIIRDITARKLADLAFSTRRRVTEILVKSPDLKMGLAEILDAILGATKIETAGITMETGAISFSVVRGFDAPNYESRLVNASTDLAADCPEDRNSHDRCWGCPATCAASVAICCLDGKIGELRVWDRRPGFISTEKRAFVEDLGLTIGLSVSRRLAEENLRNAERLALTGRLAAGVAHEIGNPLQAMSICLELVESALPENFSQMDSFHQIITGMDRIRETVSDLLDLHKITSQNARVLDLNDLIRHSSKFVSPTMRKSQIKVILDLHPAPLPVVVSEKEFFFVLSNLFANSRESISAMRETAQCRFPAPKGTKAGTVRVSTRVEADCRVIMDFSDDGPGLSDCLHPMIFEPFYTTKKATGGNGLGLATSREIVLKYGGQMTAIADSDIRGATFRVVLPLTTVEGDVL